MTETATNAESYRVTADELRQFVERVERLDADGDCMAHGSWPHAFGWG